MNLTTQKKQASARADHPAAKVVGAFHEMRESCSHYRGIKNRPESLQCTHKSASRVSNWCAMDCCPLVRERALSESV